jgi:hypothetical protein
LICDDDDDDGGDLGEIVCGDMHWQDIVNIVMNLWVQ